MLLLALTLAAMPLQANGIPLGLIAFDRRHDSRAGTVTLDLTIGADGTLERCDVVDQRGSGHLDRDVCNGFRRGRFIPARDGQGAPIPAFIRYIYSTLPERSGQLTPAAIRAAAMAMPVKTDFAIPVDHLPATATKPAAAVLLVTGPDGKVADCIVGTTSGNSLLDRLACTTMATTDLTPVHDGAGRPIRALRELAIGFVVTPAAVVRP